MLKTEVFSKLSKTAPHTLATYKEAGLLLPEQDGSYHEIQLAVADQIGALCEVGFELSSILEIWGNRTGMMHFSGEMVLQNPALREKRLYFSRRFRLLDSARDQFRADGSGMRVPVERKTAEPCTVASLRKSLSSLEEERSLWASFMANGAALSLGEMRRTLFHDPIYTENLFDVEVQRSVSAPFADTETLVCKTLPAETYISATIKGDYGKLYAGHEALAHWAEKNGYELDGQGLFYLYKVGVAETDNPAESVTEVCCRIKE